MGVRKTTDIVEKTTWTLAAIMVVLSVFCAYTAPQAVTDQSVMEQAATENATTNPTNTQGFGTGQQTPAADAQKATPAQQQNTPAAPKAQPAK